MRTCTSVSRCMLCRAIESHQIVWYGKSKSQSFQSAKEGCLSCRQTLHCHTYISYQLAGTVGLGFRVALPLVATWSWFRLRLWDVGWRGRWLRDRQFVRDSSTIIEKDIIARFGPRELLDVPVGEAARVGQGVAYAWRWLGSTSPSLSLCRRCHCAP